MDQDPSIEAAMAAIQSEIDAGRSIKARMLLGHCTRLDKHARKAIAKGLVPLKPEDITHTDLESFNKAGCSVSTTALIAVGFIIYHFLG